MLGNFLLSSMSLIRRKKNSMARVLNTTHLECSFSEFYPLGSKESILNRLQLQRLLLCLSSFATGVSSICPDLIQNEDAFYACKLYEIRNKSRSYFIFFPPEREKEASNCNFSQTFVPDGVVASTLTVTWIDVK